MRIETTRLGLNNTLFPSGLLWNISCHTNTTWGWRIDCCSDLRACPGVEGRNFLKLSVRGQGVPAVPTQGWNGLHESALHKQCDRQCLEQEYCIGGQDWKSRAQCSSENRLLNFNQQCESKQFANNMIGQQYFLVFNNKKLQWECCWTWSQTKHATH